MSKFRELEITSVEKTTRNAVVLTMAPQDAAHVPFIQGQYLTFRKEFDGVELRRSYSLCCAPHEGILQVGIKRVEGGAFSTWANEQAKPGDRIQAMAPTGKFHTALDPATANNYLGFATGSGITPLLSIIKATLVTEPDSTFTLIYANRNTNEVMFREELEDLKNTHMGRLNVVHILKTDAQGIDLFTGRITREKLDSLFELWVDLSNIDMTFICGPEELMHIIVKALEDHGLAKDRIKYELFASTQPGRVARTSETTANANSEGSHATILLDGASLDMEIQPGQTVLEAALANDIEAPFACKAGVCSTCKCRVVEGEVEMVTNHALEDYEVEAGYVLSCQSFPTSKSVIVEYEDH